MSKDPLRYFRQEAVELLELLSNGLLDLECEYSQATAAALLRHAHTLKGAARVVKLKDLADHVHSLEDLLENFRHQLPAQPTSLINQALRWLDRIQASLNQLSPDHAPTTRAVRSEDMAGQHVDPAEIQTLLGDVSQAYTRLGEMRVGASAWNEVAFLSTQPETGSEILEIARRQGRELQAQIEHLQSELRAMHQTVEQLRLQPLSSLYTSLQRSLRDAAQEAGISAQFLAQGPDVRLEEGTLRLVRAALVQAVRNAVAHGIEPAEQRRQLGKEPTGRVELKVERKGSWLWLTLSDDGRGVEAAALASAGSLEELLEGGVSTSRSVSQLSGRGVGMDVIRESAQRLGGELRLESQPEQGFHLHLRFPVQAASLPALRVRSRSRSLLLPLDCVLKVTHQESPELSELPGIGLAELLAWSGPTQDEKIQVLVSSAVGQAVLRVEAVDGMVQTLVHPLPRLAPAHPAISGAALDLEGRPELVLDPARLKNFGPAPKFQSQPDLVARILVVDDSLTTRILEQTILESRGFQVDLADSGEEALHKVLTREYDLFLVDAEMPGMSGFELIRQLRERPREKHIPIVMVSSLPRSEYAPAAFEAGAQGYHEKSQFDQEELVREIRRLLA
ncbi:response regulator [bacterium]|nr:response regulator [bacterium]